MSGTITASTYNPHRQLTWFLRILSACLGLVQLWGTRYIIFSDGISYLDIADAYRRGDWANAINAYWSPLYSWILAIAASILRPSPAWSVPTLHLVNFLSFLTSLATFEFFLVSLAKYLRLPNLPKSWLIFGYSLVVWSGLTRVTVGYVSPDIAVTVIVFLLAAMLLKLREKPDDKRLFVAFGILLGFAYFIKGVFFAAAFSVFLPATIVSLRRRALRQSALAAAAFIVTCSPFIAALSFQKGRLTFGDTGKLNYGWEILQAARSTHWQGEPFNIGAPSHPTRKALDVPQTYVFDQPIAGTYPPWYDPSYWYEGIKPHLELGRQLMFLRLNSIYALIQIIIAPGALLLLVVVFGNLRPRWLAVDTIKNYWFLILPGLGSILIYCSVFVDRRYIPSFIIVVLMALWAAVYQEFRGVRILVASIVFVAAVSTVLLLARPGTLALNTVLHDFPFARSKPLPNPDWAIAQGARANGLEPKEKIAYIGLAISADWVRLNQNRIIAEITVLYDRNDSPARAVYLNDREIVTFWRSEPGVQERVLEEFRKAGATWAVADYVPSWADTSGWVRVGGDGVNTTFLRKL